jgi:hypothetical protein
MPTLVYILMFVMIKIPLTFIICLLGAINWVGAQHVDVEEDPAEKFKQSYEQVAPQSILWRVRRLNLFQTEKPTVYRHYLELPDNKSLLYSAYDVYPVHLSSALAFGGQGTRMQPVSSNVWVGVDQRYNTPEYLFLRGLFEPYGLGTGLMQSWLGGPLPMGWR